MPEIDDLDDDAFSVVDDGECPECGAGSDEHCDPDCSQGEPNDDSVEDWQ